MPAAATAVRVLIVDDPDAASALAGALSAEGFDATTVPGVGLAPIRLEAGLLPRVVILELNLPDASGGLILRRIRRDKLPIKVAVVTAVPDPRSHLDFQLHPPDVLFQKPLDFPDLLKWIRSVT